MAGRYTEVEENMLRVGVVGAEEPLCNRPPPRLSCVVYIKYQSIKRLS